mmetsp:Transcript_4863/g.18220  ORF Transcript_4863/g.18220 Transcript_4863/m.18220 type:complete len:651 (-) Transcript_4863:82-2034(-)|eukprot:CAMPEP_0117443482 /NCGR_PEP_ID=MMETSP0759-20121206/4716_1 /TAXON_ID=63605 /ORGANISM="Percolomonas cosmopolitus, Strain WS" /LENGTH=650 /DNA_ID=CAMNT_0005235455 /DNA_START=200 /DNA_END=2152 /DNA_ORIENTATION=-
MKSIAKKLKPSFGSSSSNGSNRHSVSGSGGQPSSLAGSSSAPGGGNSASPNNQQHASSNGSSHTAPSPHAAVSSSDAPSNKRKSKMIRSVKEVFTGGGSASSNGQVANVQQQGQQHISPVTPQQKKKGQKTFRKPQDLERLSLLGEGSFGEVFLVRNKETSALHALKVMKLDNESSAEQIMKEIDILHEADSKYIVRYDGYYLEKNCLSILMEYCAGGSLQEMMTALQRPFTEVEVACCIRSLLKALQSLHKSKKIHRDIKSGNVLMNEEGRVKLADFGVSRELMNSSSLARTVIGTPLWMAPDVIEGKKYSFPADIWSVGITTIELAEGRPPLSNVPNMRALFLIPQRPPPTLAHPEQFSDDMNDFVAQCLQKNPNDRPTASALLKHSFLRKQAKKSKKVFTILLDEINQRYQEAGGKEEYFRQLRAKHEEPLTEQSTIDSLDTGSDSSDSDDGNYDTMIMNSNTQTYADTSEMGSDDESDDDSSSSGDNYGTMVVKKSTNNTNTTRIEPTITSKDDVSAQDSGAAKVGSTTLTEDQIDILCAEYQQLSREEVLHKVDSLESDMKKEIEALKDDFEVRRKAILQIRYKKEQKQAARVGGRVNSFGQTPPTLPSRSSKPDLRKLMELNENGDEVQQQEQPPKEEESTVKL